MLLRYLSILSIAALIILTVYGREKNTATRFDESREIVILRKICHELLLSSGDSSSRILPVKQISEDEFHVFPENELSIMPDSFVNIVTRVVEQNKLTRDFTANIIQCRKKEMVYGFAVAAPGKDDLVTCVGRKLDKDCYYLSFIFSPAKKSGLQNHYYLGGALIALTALGFLMYRLQNKKKLSTDPFVPGKAESGNHILIGKYFFRYEHQYLELNGEKTPLTSKESKLLYILASSPNVIIERSTLQKEVWENEGVIVTRSLDMFVSKLRKKLAADASIRIVNVHGKGYKLEIATT